MYDNMNEYRRNRKHKMNEKGTISIPQEGDEPFLDSKTDSVGEFIRLLYAAGLLSCKASAAKRETCVGRSEGSMSQETIRLTLIAVAVITCCRCVFGNPNSVPVADH
jgi:hypothetical protein